MEITFMTIHNLSPDANILFASESIYEILGYQPHEVIGRSCFEYFHPDEVPFARSVHNRGVTLDKAAVLNYARVKGAHGAWVDCECVFTIVYDVLVACTSIYKHSLRSHQRALDAPKIRRLFSSSPKDPRYHMLEHLSPKFVSSPEPAIREPRAALILNRFTRTSTILFATNAVATILGITASDLSGKSFYECIQENCLEGAIRCLESAKANDSIAYLRFWYRDPVRQSDLEDAEREGSLSSDSEGGGVVLDTPMNLDGQPNVQTHVTGHQQHDHLVNQSRTASADSGDSSTDVNMFDSDPAEGTKFRSMRNAEKHKSRDQGAVVSGPIELEAVVSCTSDGLVVVLRRARPIILNSYDTLSPSYANGFFAAPWGVDSYEPQPKSSGEVHGAPDESQNGSHSHLTRSSTLSPRSTSDFMDSIREVAAFAWSLTGINGNIVNYGRGTARGEAIPETGFPIWDPYAQNALDESPENQAFHRWADGYQQPNNKANTNLIPYQHPHQEHLLREQQGYGDGLMGSDNLESSARAYISQNIGEDVLESSYFALPRSQQQLELYEQRNQEMAQILAESAGQTDHGNYSSSSTAFDRYLWY